MAQFPKPARIGFALGALALGAVAVGALAVGTLAIGGWPSAS
jgi:hypothetical protein